LRKSNLNNESMTLRRVFTVGETYFDIIFSQGMYISSTPGGGMLNSAVSLGRLGLSVYLISEYGEDQIGKMIEIFLNESNVNTSFVNKYPNFPTALSLAFLDENNNASYSFYKIFPENRLNIQFPPITKDDIILFSSSYGINPSTRNNLLRFIEKAKSFGAIIIYDPNFRKKQHLATDIVKKWELENFKYAHIIRGSDEDFFSLFSAQTIYEAFSNSGLSDTQTLIYTSRNKEIHLLNSTINFVLPVPHIMPQSTIGAGDAFNSGIIHSLIINQIREDEIHLLEVESWKSFLEHSLTFSNNVCLTMENYISLDFAQNIRSKTG